MQKKKATNTIHIQITANQDPIKSPAPSLRKKKCEQIQNLIYSLKQPPENKINMNFNFGSSDSPDRKIYESLEIFHRLADSNRQIASAVSEIVTNHFASSKSTLRSNFPTNLNEQIPPRNSSPVENLLQPSFTSSPFTSFSTGAYTRKAPPPTKQQPFTKTKQAPKSETVFSLSSKPLPAQASSAHKPQCGDANDSTYCEITRQPEQGPSNKDLIKAKSVEQRQSRRKLFHQPSTLDCSDTNDSANCEIATQPEQRRKSEVSSLSTLPSNPPHASCEITTQPEQRRKSEVSSLSTLLSNPLQSSQPSNDPVPIWPENDPYPSLPQAPADLTKAISVEQHLSHHQLFHQPSTLDCGDAKNSANCEIVTQPEQHQNCEVSSPSTLPQPAQCVLECRGDDHQEILTDQTDPDLPGLESSSSTAESARVYRKPRGKFWHSDSESSTTSSPTRTQSTLPGYWTSTSATYDTPSQQYELLEPAEDRLTCQKAGETMEVEHNITSDPEAPTTGQFDDDNPFAPLQLLPEFKNEPPKRRKKKSRPKGGQLQSLSSDDLDNLYLEEASRRNEITRHYFIEGQEITTRKELIRAEVNDANCLSSLLLSSVHSTELLSEYRQKHQGHIHQHQELLLQGIYELEAAARNDILSHHKSRNYKIFGPDQTPPDRVVLAFVIKQNSYNKAFQLAWREMTQCNGGYIDPFHHTEITMTNFLRMQGLLRGPVITHYPVKLPTKSWFRIVEQEAAEHALENQMTNVLLSTAQQFSSTEELGCHSTELPPLQDLCLYNTCIFESMSRNIIQLQLLKERTQLTGSEPAIHLASHMLCLHEQFLECCKQKWDLL